MNYAQQSRLSRGSLAIAAVTALALAARKEDDPARNEDDRENPLLFRNPKHDAERIAAAEAKRARKAAKKCQQNDQSS